MNIRGQILDIGVIKVKATFLGQDGSMGFHKGDRYDMWYFHKNGKFYMSKPHMRSTAIPYDTLPALEKNWRII